MNGKSSQRQVAPTVLLYNKAPDGKSCQAAWYDQSVEATARLFGGRQGFTVLGIPPGQANQVQAALSEGTAADKGVLSLHVVKSDVLDRLLAALSASHVTIPPNLTKPTATVGKAAASVTSTTTVTSPTIDPLWAALTVNMVVLAPELTDGGATDGWWEAIITAIQGDMLTLQFRDYPEQAPVRRKREQLAVMYPPPVRA